MNDPQPQAPDLLHAAALCRWPPVTVPPSSRVPLRDEETWRRIVPRLTPGERRAVLRRLGQRELLVATAGGRARLRTWLNRRWAGLGDSAARLPYYGDETMAPAVEHALSRLPPPVRDFAVGTCAVIAVGVSVTGWTSAPLKIDELYPIVLSGSGLGFAEIGRLALHEVAHAWHRPPPGSGARALTVAEYAEALAYARANAWPVAKAAARRADDERLAQLCTMAWAA